jgi:hypothetical protein
MLWSLDPIWLALTIGMVAILSYLLGIVVDALVDDDAFGPVGNMLILMSGFVTAILAANHEGVAFRGLDTATGVGLAGAFTAIILFAIAKAGLERL